MWMEFYVRKVNTILNGDISWNHYLRRIIIHFIVLFLRQNAAELLLKIQIVFGDQASVNMQEVALMQVGRGTGKG